MSEGLLAQRLWVLCAAGWLLFSYPLLRLWLADRSWLGLPLLPAANSTHSRCASRPSLIVVSSCGVKARRA